MRRAHAGLSLLEIVVVIAIGSLLTLLVVESFRSIKNIRTLDGETFRIIAELQEARSLTLASKGAQSYGVRLESNRMTLFPGSSYTSSSNNTVNDLNAAITITPALVGGGIDVVFERLTGKTNMSGTITVSVGSSTKSITVYPTGLVEAH